MHVIKVYRFVNTYSEVMIVNDEKYYGRNMPSKPNIPFQKAVNVSRKVQLNVQERAATGINEIDIEEPQLFFDREEEIERE